MDWTHPEAGGVEVNLRETLSRLSDRGHEVHLLTSRYPDSDSQEKLEGVNIHRYGLEGRTNEITVLTAGQLYLSYLSWKLNPDVIYTFHSILGWFPISRKPKVTAIHHIYEGSVFEQYSFPFNLAGYIAESLSLFFSRNRNTVSVSPSTTRKLVDRGFSREKVVEIVNGVDKESYTPGEESEVPKVLYLGRLEHNKGADILPEIYGRLEERLEDFTFEIAGSGSMEDEAEELARGNEDVVFHGYVDEGLKRQLLKESWVVISPSRFEGWGMVVSEANASGTPVVGFDTDGLKDSIKDGETGYLVDPEEEESLENFSERVVDLVDDDDLREEMSKKGREVAESRDWEDAVDVLEDLFRKLGEDKEI